MIEYMENTELLNQLLDILLPVLATFLTAVFTYLGNRLKKVYEEKVNNETAKVVVADAVRFVEQVYKDLNGPEKLNMATEKVAEVLQSKGISISEAEINMLIESAVYSLKEGWFTEKEVIDNGNETEVIEEELPNVKGKEITE